MPRVRTRPATITAAAPLAVVAALFIAITAAATLQILHAVGEPIYPIDDVYIHMAMARSLAEHGVYGVTPHEATHASSSPAWVLLLAAAFAATGPWTWWPGLLAGVASLALLAIASMYLRLQATGLAGFADVGGRTGVRSLTVPGGSVPALTLQGMEHPLLAAAILLAAVLGAQAIADPQPHRRRDMALAALCFVLPLLRYESLWLTALLAAALLWRRRRGLALALLAASAAAVCAVGFWAISQGLTFLPAPILTKSVGPLLLSEDGLQRLVARFTWHPLSRISRVPLLAVLFAAAVAWLAVALWRRRLGLLDDARAIMVALFAGGTWIHATFATFGWGSRYEAYLIALGIAALGATALALPGSLDGARRPHRLAGLLAEKLAHLPKYSALERAHRPYAKTQRAPVEGPNRDVFVARFLAAAYPGDSVLAMNIGAVVWAGSPRLTDPVALGTPAALDLFLAGRLNAGTVDALAAERGVQVFAVFDEWFAEWLGGSPPWLAAAEIDASNQRRRLLLRLYVRDEVAGRTLAERLTRIRPEGRFSAEMRLLAPFGPH